jgi:hypothetical protein
MVVRSEETIASMKKTKTSSRSMEGRQAGEGREGLREEEERGKLV